MICWLCNCLREYFPWLSYTSRCSYQDVVKVNELEKWETEAQEKEKLCSSLQASCRWAAYKMINITNCEQCLGFHLPREDLTREAS